METPGLSFSPLGNDASKRPTGDAQNTPVQEAIRVLSLRVPHVSGGAPSVAPNALLAGSGSGGLAPGGMGGTNLGLEQLLRRLFGMPATGSFAPPMGVPGAPSGGMGGGGGMGTLMPGGGGSAPAPHVTPIGPSNPGPVQGGPVELPPVPGAGWGGYDPSGPFTPGGYDPTQP